MTTSVNIRDYRGLVTVLEKALEGVPAKIRATNTAIAIIVDDSSYELRVRSAGEGWPSDVKEALSRTPEPWPRHLIVAARHLSPGSIKLLRSRNANWIDAVGNVHIYVPPALLIDRLAPLTASPPEFRFSWRPSSVDIAEELLSHRPERIRVIDLVRKTGWSAAQLTSVLHGFDERGWTRRYGAGRGPSVWRELANAGSLLEAWSAHLSSQKRSVRFAHGLMRDPTEYMIEKMAPVLTAATQWAATTWVAANLLAPYSTFLPSLHLYVLSGFLLSHSFEAALAAVGLSEVETGANVEFRAADARLFKRLQQKRIPLVSSPRVYADLMALGGRAEDAAKHLRETVLGY